MIVLFNTIPKANYNKALETAELVLKIGVERVLRHQGGGKGGTVLPLPVGAALCGG